MGSWIVRWTTSPQTSRRMPMSSNKSRRCGRLGQRCISLLKQSLQVSVKKMADRQWSWWIHMQSYYTHSVYHLIVTDLWCVCNFKTCELRIRRDLIRCSSEFFELVKNGWSLQDSWGCGLFLEAEVEPEGAGWKVAVEKWPFDLTLGSARACEISQVKNLQSPKEDDDMEGVEASTPTATNLEAIQLNASRRGWWLSSKHDISSCTIWTCRNHFFRLRKSLKCIK